MSLFAHLKVVQYSQILVKVIISLRLYLFEILTISLNKQTNKKPLNLQMNNFKGRGESDGTIMMGKNSPKIMAGMETWRCQKIQQKMTHDPEYRKRK